MGARLFTKNEIDSVHYKSSKRVIPLANWRAIRQHPNHAANSLYVILPNFRMYLIHKFTIEEFHLANYNNELLDIPFEYIKNVLSCEKCHGEGRLDWVELSRGKPSLVEHAFFHEFKYTRHRKGKVYIIKVGETPYHVSTAYLRKGYEHCDQCLGTGLVMAKEHLIQSEYILEKS
jgi:glycosidase